MRIVLVGDAGVGKTCFLQRIANDKFIEPYHSSESYCLNWKKVEYANKKYFIMDTAGQEKLGITSPLGWSDADVFFVMFDLTNKNSYRSTLWWIKKIKTVNMTARLVLVGTKSDSESRKVTQQDMQLHKKYTIPYTEVSSKKDLCNEVFCLL